MIKYLLIFLVSFNVIAQSNVQKTFGTYYFKNRAVPISTKIDNQGNIIVIGFIEVNSIENISTYSQFTTPNCYQNTLNSEIDGFIAKFNPQGGLLWATYFGGESNDSCLYFQIDTDNNIYLAGKTTSFTHIATSGSYIDNVVEMYSTTSYLAKFSEDGNLIWSTYIPGSVSNLKIRNNELIVGGYTDNPNGVSTIGAYREVPEQYLIGGIPSTRYGFIMKFNLNGIRTYGTYLEKCGDRLTFEIDDEGNYIIADRIPPNLSIFFTPTLNCHQSNYGGGTFDVFITKFNSDLTNILWSTYFGGNLSEYIYDIKLNQNDIYIAGVTRSPNNIATPNAHQSTISGSKFYGYIANFSKDGVLLWSTYFGGNGSIDSDLANITIFNNKLYVVGGIEGSTNLSTTGSFQENYEEIIVNASTIKPGFFAEFSLNGSLNWSSYFTGTNIRNIEFLNNDTFYLSGFTSNPNGIATPNAIQPNLIQNAIPTSGVPKNMFLCKFEFTTLSTPQFSTSNFQLFPNPNHGVFSLKGTVNDFSNLKLTFTDLLGRMVYEQKIVAFSNQLDTSIDVRNQLSKGVYFVNLYNKEKQVQTFKIIVE